MTDSPPHSYIPLSLNDTLKAQRMLPRSTPSGQRAGSSISRPSHAHTQAQARSDARRMMTALGMSPEEESRAAAEAQDETTEGGATTRPALPARTTSSASSATSGADQQELAALRRRISALEKANKELEARCERAERDKAKALAGQGNGGAAVGSLDAKQLAELEQSFADQERLLTGYQVQSEKEQAEREVLQRKLRKYTEVLARAFGDDFEQTLINAPLPSIAVSSSSAFSSPALRSKLARQSLAGTPTASLPLRRRPSDRLPQESLAEEDEEVGDATVGGLSEVDGSLLRPEALQAHLDAVQSLLRSMEKRIIDRETELVGVEKRAREETRKAQEKAVELEELVQRLREERA